MRRSESIKLSKAYALDAQLKLFDFFQRAPQP